MLKIVNIKTDIDTALSADIICKRALIPVDELLEFKIVNKSVDARKKPDIYYNYSVCVKLKNEKKYADNPNVLPYNEVKYEFRKNNAKMKNPVIVGSGPAGLFAGLVLAEAGVNPIIIERGECVEKRLQAVENFWKTGELDKNTNVQFGEGGAGTFSDGKLTTGINDARLSFIKEQFVKFGAPEEILYLTKPHIGTDKLCICVQNIRNEIKRLGGSVLFNTKLVDVGIENNRVICAICEQNGEKLEIATDDIILATGHSARDTVRMLYDKGIEMERKTFSIGGRIEHLQKDIGLSQYGESYKNLPPADYKLAVKTKDGRGVYTFCMCPGGYVVASASETGGVVTNGMSYFKRDNTNANSALLVTVNPEDIEGEDVLGGIELQEKIEKRAFEAAGGNYYAPVSLVGDFLNNRVSDSFGSVLPTYKPGTVFCELRDILPEFISNSMAEGIVLMDKRLKGFATPDAIITVPETRSSSPVRILRNRETLQAKINGLYPCGEGAGFAGGIMSAALDGIKCAEALMEKYNQKAD